MGYNYIQKEDFNYQLSFYITYGYPYGYPILIRYDSLSMAFTGQEVHCMIVEESDKFALNIDDLIKELKKAYELKNTTYFSPIKKITKSTLQKLLSMDDVQIMEHLN